VIEVCCCVAVFLVEGVFGVAENFLVGGDLRWWDFVAEMIFCCGDFFNIEKMMVGGVLNP
jgi:hypothetical protein